MFKKAISVLLIVVMTFALGACGANVSQDTASGDLTYAEWVYSASPGDLESADPYGSTTARTEWLTNMTFNKLVAYNEDTGKVEPELATKWESNETSDEWTFWLRNDVTFHNGDHMTAQDVKFTYLHTANLGDTVNVIKTFAAGSYAESVDVIDDYTIKFVLKQPYKKRFYCRPSAQNGWILRLL